MRTHVKDVEKKLVVPTNSLPMVFYLKFLPFLLLISSRTVDADYFPPSAYSDFSTTKIFWAYLSVLIHDIAH